MIEGIEKCNVSPLSPVLGRMYSIEDIVYSPVPSITNQKVAPFSQLSWRDEAIMLKKEVGGTKQPSFHSLLNLLLPNLLQVNHVLLLPLFCLMWDADQLGKALTRGTAC